MHMLRALVRNAAPTSNSANLKWENAANQIALKPTEDILQNYVQDHVQNGAQMRAMGDTMSLLGNIIWILFGGIFTAIYWFFVGCLFCLTIVGIPLGRQAFKMASLTLAPFGKTIEYGGGAPSLIANIIWVVVAGIPMAFAYLVAGAVNCITIIGIPFGLQSFKMAKLSLLPFGARVN